jgi:outer membrane protein TolC
MRTLRRSSLAVLTALATFAVGTTSSVAFAQTAAPAAAPEAGSDAAREAALNAQILAPKPGGLTADAVALRAAQTSFTAQAQEQVLRGAAARLDAAWAAFLPRLSGTFRYTRLSDLTLPSLFPSTVNFVGTTAPGGTLNPAPTVAISLAGASFPVILDNWLIQGTLVVPLSDYVFRLTQNYSAANKSVTAAKYDLAVARAKSATEGRIAYYNWLRARGSVVVAKLALEDQKTHLGDTRNLLEAGKASKVDVLRGETGVAAAELAVEQATHFSELGEAQVRIAIHAKDDEAIAIGETVDGDVPAYGGVLTALVAEGQSNRLEIKSLKATSDALHDQATVLRAGAYPQLAAVGNVTYANPNQRLILAQAQWFPTWDVSLQLTWSPNDVVSARANGADVESKAAQLEAQKQAVRDGIALEVTQAFQAVQEADFSLRSTDKQLVSAREAVRVARELFKAGLVTSTTLTDAETELTRARLQSLNAHVDARIARVRLDHALGRDTKDTKVE